MSYNYRIIFDAAINNSHLTIIKIYALDAIYLYDIHKPDFICNFPYGDNHKLFFYNREIKIEHSMLEDIGGDSYGINRYSDILKYPDGDYAAKVILLDIENGTDIIFENYHDNHNMFSGSIFIPLDGYNEYSSITFLDNNLSNSIFYNLPRSMRIYINSENNGKMVFGNTECSIIVNENIKSSELLDRIIGKNIIDIYNIDDPLDSIRNFNEKRGLIEQGFDLRRELNFIVEEVVEATNINLDSDKAKEKAKVIVDKLLKECVTTNENSMDAFIDIIVFAVGALYKLAPRMNIDVKEEIMKVIRNIEFKPYIKDENGKVIKDPNYKKYREK